MIKGVLFDMDGVLVDNAPIHIEAFRIFCEGYGVKLNVAALTQVFGMGNDDILPRVLPEEILEGKDIDQLGRDKEDIYRKIFENSIEPTRGLVDFLGQLRAAGIKMAVGSSGPENNVNFVLDKCGIRDMFDAVVNGDMVDERKPAPDIYLEAARLLGLDPSQCVVIEDAHPGTVAARAAGTKLICLATTFPKEKLAEWDCDLIANDFTELSPETLKTL